MKELHSSIAQKTCGWLNRQLLIRAEVLRFSATSETSRSSFSRKIRKKRSGLFKSTSKNHSFTKLASLICESGQ